LEAVKSRSDSEGESEWRRGSERRWRGAVGILEGNGGRDGNVRVSTAGRLASCSINVVVVVAILSMLRVVKIDIPKRRDAL